MMRQWTHALCLGLALTALSACSQAKRDSHPAAANANVSAKRATAVLAPLSHSRAVGVVTFIATDKGVRVVADVEGLTPGSHGFHIHEYGVCQGDGSSAGAHFNPDNNKHGSPTDTDRHSGDLGNLIADELGNAHYERIDSKITLSGPNSIVGRSVIVHENIDDFVTQPSGNAGGRISCGIIEKIE